MEPFENLHSELASRHRCRENEEWLNEEEARLEEEFRSYMNFLASHVPDFQQIARILKHLNLIEEAKRAIDSKRKAWHPPSHKREDIEPEWNAMLRSLTERQLDEIDAVLNLVHNFQPRVKAAAAVEYKESRNSPHVVREWIRRFQNRIKEKGQYAMPRQVSTHSACGCPHEEGYAFLVEKKDGKYVHSKSRNEYEKGRYESRCGKPVLEEE